MDVSIIIINYKNAELTIDAIKSIYEKTIGINFEIIVIDNDSNDNIEKKLNENFKNGIKFIQSSKNLGFGRANNLGLKLSNGKYVFLLNNDTLLINNAIKILYDFMELNNGVAVCGGNLYDIDMNPTQSFGSLPKNENLIFSLTRSFYKSIFKIRSKFNFTKKSKKAGYIVGADMMIRKEILERSGAFDDDFFLYFEETELTYRIKKLGYKVYSVPNAKIIHYESATTASIGKLKFYYEGMIKYYLKVFGEKSIRRAINNHIIDCKIRNIILRKKIFCDMIDTAKEQYNEFLCNNNKKVL